MWINAQRYLVVGLVALTECVLILVHGWVLANSSLPGTEKHPIAERITFLFLFDWMIVFIHLLNLLALATTAAWVIATRPPSWKSAEEEDVLVPESRRPVVIGAVLVAVVWTLVFAASVYVRHRVRLAV